MLTAVLIVSSIAALLLFYLAYRTHREGPEKAELAGLRARREDFLQTAGKLESAQARTEDLQMENASLRTALENEKNNIKLLRESDERLAKEFENLSNRIFENRSRVFAEQNVERISSLLKPFRDQMESFRKRVDDIHTEGTKNSARLIEQIRQLQQLSSRVSDDANNLARAIKGESKAQGDWGELIVERIFEASGLQKGLEYETQAYERDSEGRLRKPDFLVRLPGDKMVIVDSKVSLTAYERFANCEQEDERAAELKLHLASVKKHVEELRQKDYHSLHGNRSLDFVIMCIPLEPAYQAAMQADPGLIYDLARTNVVISGPSTLLISLKLIAQIWRREKENRNAEEIADRAGKLYDKFAGMMEALDKTRSQFNAASTSLETAISRATGRGGLISSFEKLRALGANAGRQLPKATEEVE